MFEFRHSGKIVPKGRPRLARGRIHTPKRTKQYQQDLALAALVARGPWRALEGPVCLRVQLFYRCPNSKTAQSPCFGGGGRGDLDNVLKAISDACNGVLYLDDRQIVELAARQSYAPPGQDEFVLVNVEEVSL